MVAITGKILSAVGGESLRLTVEGAGGKVWTIELNRASMKGLSKNPAEFTRNAKGHELTLNVEED
ncbi:hypothetical protein CMO91_01125 [Candidatus Woesearchaeota archaeon]|nr:hypothetical protein [Candidatus Woesearchaeota archaeon]|tara:strand:+ start:1517 stop:1711 length:195 start_codon:yes stop_codon:yes gene_type:complete